MVLYSQLRTGLNPFFTEWVFVKRRGNTKAKVAVEQFKALKIQFLFDLKATVELLEIPPELVFNWDQMGIKIVVSSWSIEKRGALRLLVLMIRGK